MPLGLYPGRVRVVVAVVNEVLRNGMAVIGVEFLEHRLGDLPLLLPDLLQEMIGLVTAKNREVVALKIDMLQVAELLKLIRADRRFPGCPIRNVKGPINRVGLYPRLGGNGDVRMPLGNPPVTAMDLRVGETRAGDADRGPTPGCAESVMGSPPADAQRGVVFSEVPTNAGKDLYRSSETEKPHGVRDSGVKRGLRPEILDAVSELLIANGNGEGREWKGIEGLLDQRGRSPCGPLRRSEDFLREIFLERGLVSFEGVGWPFD